MLELDFRAVKFLFFPRRDIYIYIFLSIFSLKSFDKDNKSREFLFTFNLIIGAGVHVSFINIPHLRDKDSIQIVCFKVVEEVKKLRKLAPATFAFYGL